MKTPGREADSAHDNRSLAKPPHLLGVKRFAIIPSFAIEHLAGIESAIYTVLSLHANAQSECWPSISTIAKIARVSERHARRTLRDLEMAGFILSFRNAARGGANIYVLQPDPHAWVDSQRAENSIFYDAASMLYWQLHDARQENPRLAVRIVSRSKGSADDFEAHINPPELDDGSPDRRQHHRATRNDAEFTFGVDRRAVRCAVRSDFPPPAIGTERDEVGSIGRDDETHEFAPSRPCKADDVGVSCPHPVRTCPFGCACGDRRLTPRHPLRLAGGVRG